MRTPLLPIKIYSSYCFCVGSCVAVAWVRSDTLCTIPNPSHEKLRKQNALFLFFYGVPLPPPKGTKDQGRKLAPETGKDIITYSRAEPSGLHPCHRQQSDAIFKGKGITSKERREVADGSCLTMVCAMAVRGLRKGY